VIESREVSKATCDGCGKIQYAEDGFFHGIHGQLLDTTEAATLDVDFFACSQRHVSRAAAAVLAGARALKRRIPAGQGAAASAPGAEPTP
jgi:hypothetical protein